VSIQSRYLHTLVVKRNEPSAGTAAETVGGANTTLTADTAVGATTIAVASAVGIAATNWLRVGDTGETEIRQVASLAVLVVTLTAPLTLAHDTGDVVREVDDSGTPTVDDYGQPDVSPVTFATVPGLVQPRRAREVALASQAGVVLGEHIGYLDPLAGLKTSDWIEVGGIRYDILSIADAGGVGHHLELGLKQVQ
jgi:hypothetical protein